MNSPRTPEESAAKRKLMNVATQLFAERGLSGTSIRDIAKQADLNISLISYYFDGKEGLYKAIIQDFAETAQEKLFHLFRAFEAEDLQKKTFQKQMGQLIRLIVEHKMSTPALQQIMQREMLEGLPFAREIFESVLNTMGEAIVQMVVRAQKKKIIRADLHGHLWFMAMLHSIDSILLCSTCSTTFTDKSLQLPQDTDLLIEQLEKIFVEGVLL